MTREHEVLGQPETRPTEALTLQQAEKLFFLSFRFSQGYGSLHGSIFDYLHFLHPDWNITEEFRHQLIEAANKHFSNFLHNKTISMHKKISNGYKDALEDAAENMQKRFNQQNDATPILPEMTSFVGWVVNRDYKYLVEPNRESLRYKLGRPRENNPKPARYNPLTDPFLSHICWYGIEGNPTGAWEYDWMFANIKEGALRILKIDQSDEVTKRIKTRLVNIISKYHATHPNNKTASIIRESGIDIV